MTEFCKAVYREVMSADNVLPINVLKCSALFVNCASIGSYDMA